VLKALTQRAVGILGIGKQDEQGGCMVNRLRDVFERAQQRPEEEQEYIAELVLRELEDQEWEGSDALRAAIEASDAAYAAGDAMDFEEYDRRGSSKPWIIPTACV
jgi:hypothetical protein